MFISAMHHTHQLLKCLCCLGEDAAGAAAEPQKGRSVLAVASGLANGRGPRCHGRRLYGPAGLRRQEGDPRPVMALQRKWLAPPPPPNPLAQAPTAPVKAPPHKAMPSQRPLPSAAPAPAAAAEVAAAAAAPHPQPQQLAYDALRQRLASPDSRHPRYDELPPPPPPPRAAACVPRRPPPPPPWPPVPVKQKPTAAVKTTQKTAVMPGAPQEALEAPRPGQGDRSIHRPEHVLGRPRPPRVKVKPPPAGFGPGHAPAGHAPLGPPVKPRPRTPPPADAADSAGQAASPESHHGDWKQCRLRGRLRMLSRSWRMHSNGLMLRNWLPVALALPLSC